MTDIRTADAIRNDLFYGPEGFMLAFQAAVICLKEENNLEVQEFPHPVWKDPRDTYMFAMGRCVGFVLRLSEMGSLTPDDVSRVKYAIEAIGSMSAACSRKRSSVLVDSIVRQARDTLHDCLYLRSSR